MQAGSFKFVEDLERPVLEEVPVELMRYTNNVEDFGAFQLAGYEVYTMLDAAARKHAGRALHKMSSILDFGCGAGRVLQFIPAGPAISGCDVNGPLVSFTSRRFAQADIFQNRMAPPLERPDDSYDLIYSFSVFSHLPLEDETRWLTELARVGRPGCLYLITVHGDWFIEATMPAHEQAQMAQAGFMYRPVHVRTGSEMDFPEGYEASYHTGDYIRRAWGEILDVLEIYNGRSALNFDWPGAPPQLAGTLAGLRPMGQDLVVLRKP